MSSIHNSTSKISLDIAKLGLIWLILALLIYMLTVVLITIDAQKEENKLFEEKLYYISENMVTKEQWEDGLIINIE